MLQATARARATAVKEKAAILGTASPAQFGLHRQPKSSPWLPRQTRLSLPGCRNLLQVHLRLLEGMEATADREEGAVEDLEAEAVDGVAALDRQACQGTRRP